MRLDRGFRGRVDLLGDVDLDRREDAFVQLLGPGQDGFDAERGVVSGSTGTFAWRDDARGPRAVDVVSGTLDGAGADFLQRRLDDVSSTRELTAVDGASGRPLWSVEHPDGGVFVLGGVLGDVDGDGSVDSYVGLGDRLTVLSGRSGQALWSTLPGSFR